MAVPGVKRQTSASDIKQSPGSKESAGPVTIQGSRASQPPKPRNE